MMATVVHSDPKVMHGAVVFRGTRVPSETLWDYLESGDSLEDFLTDFPTVSKEQALSLIHRAKELLSVEVGKNRTRQSLRR